MPGILYVVATPIGNLADISPRAVQALREADIVACEDTRTSLVLLAHYGVRARTLALHEHNERAATQKLLAALREGRSVALISDAGTPAVADPGARLVEAAHAARCRVLVLPGPNAAVAAWSASGFAGDSFLFVGFLPAKRSARRKALDALDPGCATIFYEAPHRVRETLEDLQARFGGEREVVLCRELTKKFEEIARMPLGAALEWLAGGPHREQGEFVLVLGPGSIEPPDTAANGERVLKILLGSLPPSEAARLAARITGAPRNALYRKAAAGKKVE